MRTATAATLDLSTDDLSTDLDAGQSGLLAGYRFSVCDTPESFARALEVRRQIYVGNIGYEVPVPDSYDARSWLLLAEHVASGRAVGTMRLTPRFGGAFELEEYFTLPRELQSPRAVELSRFAILPEFRKGTTFVPVVSLGLFMLTRSWLDRIGAHLMVICAKPEKVWTYEWLRFQRTGRTAPYGKLGNVEHELLWCDFRRWCDARGDVTFQDHPFREFFTARHREVEVPTEMPRLDLAADVRCPLAQVA
jgi:N-acyl-L-homoserine lactone synthetase